MKRKDLVVIVVVVVISTIFSFVVSNLVFGSPSKRQQQAENVSPVSDVFPPLDKRYFNDKSLNPTKVIVIGNNANQQPFNDPGQ